MYKYIIIFALKDLSNSKEGHALDLSSSFQQEILRQIMQGFFCVNICCEYSIEAMLHTACIFELFILCIS